ELVRGDFLALTKERIKNPELLCDGIKKTLLNRYFESVKDKSISLIEKARTNTSMLFQALDTYDFDTTILRSSYNEGVWEGNTIFRIVNNIYEEEVKKLMINLNYPKIINPILKLSKEISDVEFEIEPEKEPYKQKYKLRHQDIYENGDHINKLFLPIENGDIFEITDGTGKGYYILIGQECDLMMREKGSRGSQFSTLAKINLMNKDQYVAELAKNNNYLANKFELYYFEEGTTKVGIVSFLTTSNVDFNMLDLCVFNEEGESKLDITKQFDTDLLSTSWENRYKKIIKGCTSEAKKLDMLLSEIKARNLPATVRDPIVKSILPNLGIFSPIGKSDSYENNIFNFGFRRVRRLKSFHAKYLLERYYRHLSRTAEPHDFASN
ncbi:MAG TPA: hypothetical protein VKR58_10245, partial [Aquella sp.]|nr:hypothetical protein [Aquella sp.]